MQDHRVSPFTVRLAAFCSTSSDHRPPQSTDRAIQQHFVTSKDLDKIIPTVGMALAALGSPRLNPAPHPVGVKARTQGAHHRGYQSSSHHPHLSYKLAEVPWYDSNLENDGLIASAMV
jgi:hypothetical protein